MKLFFVVVFSIYNLLFQNYQIMTSRSPSWDYSHGKTVCKRPDRKTSCTIVSPFVWNQYRISKRQKAAENFCFLKSSFSHIFFTVTPQLNLRTLYFAQTLNLRSRGAQKSGQPEISQNFQFSWNFKKDHTVFFGVKRCFFGVKRCFFGVTRFRSKEVLK